MYVRNFSLLRGKVVSRNKGNPDNNPPMYINIDKTFPHLNSIIYKSSSGIIALTAQSCRPARPIQSACSCQES
jgi:hypothetical protein